MCALFVHTIVGFFIFSNCVWYVLFSDLNIAARLSLLAVAPVGYVGKGGGGEGGHQEDLAETHPTQATFLQGLQVVGVGSSRC